MVMERNQIEAFITIAQTKKFSTAAKRLHLSQPAISRRIQLLEQYLDSKLFQRTKKGAFLTQAGERFLPYAQRIITAMQDGAEAVQSMQKQAQGIVKLAIVGTLASTNLTVRLKQFRQLHPDVHLVLQTARSKNVSLLVQNGDVHLGLRYFEDTHPNIKSELIAKETLVLVCSAQRQFRGNMPKTIAELSGMPWVSYPIDANSSGEPFAKLLKRILLMSDIDDPEIIAIDSLTAQKRLIEADFGIGLLPMSSIVEEIQLNTVRILNIPLLNANAPVMMLSRKDGFLSLAMQSLMNTLKQ